MISGGVIAISDWKVSLNSFVTTQSNPWIKACLLSRNNCASILDKWSLFWCGVYTQWSMATKAKPVKIGWTLLWKGHPACCVLCGFLICRRDKETVRTSTEPPSIHNLLFSHSTTGSEQLGCKIQHFGCIEAVSCIHGLHQTYNGNRQRWSNQARWSHSSVSGRL